MKNPLDAALNQEPANDDAPTPAVEPAAVETALPASPTLPPAGGEKAGAAATPQPVPQTPEPGHVPLSAVLDEREKRQAAERSERSLREQLERERAEWRAANPPTPEEQRAAERYDDNLRFSRKFAEREYGKDFVAKVHDWVVAKCDSDPLFNQQMRTSDDPYEAAVQAFNREEILRLVTPGDLEQFQAWKAAQAASGQTTQPASSAKVSEDSATPASPSPPRSLADAPGNGAAANAAVNVGEGEAFRSAIG